MDIESWHTQREEDLGLQQDLRNERDEVHGEMAMLKEQLTATENQLAQTKTLWAQTESEREYLETQMKC